MANATMDQMVAKYVELRDRRAALKAEFSEADGELKGMQEKIEKWLDIQMNELGVTSVKTTAGTAYTSHVESTKVADWQAFLDFVMEERAFDLLVHNVNKTACRERMNPDRNGMYADPPPPGVDLTRIKKINIRK
jgi:hypothetical protein